MEKKKVTLKDVEHKELIVAYQEINEFLSFLEVEYENVKKLEEENS